MFIICIQGRRGCQQMYKQSLKAWEMVGYMWMGRISESS